MGIKTVIKLLFPFAFLIGCGSSTPAPTTPSPTLQAMARGSVVVAADVWDAAAQACVDSTDPVVHTKCKAVLLPARDALVTAAGALDVWQDSKAGEVGCAVATALVAVESMAADLHPSAAELSMFDDAAALARALGPCSQDAGAK